MNTIEKLIHNTMRSVTASKEVATYIAAQARLETGNFESKIFKTNRNAFGMKQAHTRPTTAIGTNLKHAVYETIYDSCIDYILWLTYNNFTQNELKDINKFKEHLKKSKYSTTQDYTERINKIYEQIKERRKNETKIN